jgi:hypothetical protein
MIAKSARRDRYRPRDTVKRGVFCGVFSMFLSVASLRRYLSRLASLKRGAEIDDARRTAEATNDDEDPHRTGKRSRPRPVAGMWHGIPISTPSKF